MREARNVKSEKVREVKNERSENYQNIAVSLGVSHEIRSLIEVYLGSLYVP